eukprot:TRINITY_DN61313_c0_g2_i1.p1 TRINITY_DN61313_c0_g2~~TRINITY_DN61313_c0_g2_i1.p1  ORF type:complete len:185 (+),score=13.44 TRINITY_DN61313_c0_g2_i1:25-579(+)
MIQSADLSELDEEIAGLVDDNALPDRTYVRHTELPDLLQKGTVLVIDVRDSDHRGGNIPGSVNAPFSEYYYDMDKLHNLVKANLKPRIARVVFHCMYSQQRGPRTCDKYLFHWNAEAENPTAVQFSVLVGGFHQWLNWALPQQRKDLLIDFNPDTWVKTERSGLVHVDDAPDPNDPNPEVLPEL